MAGGDSERSEPLIEAEVGEEGANSGGQWWKKALVLDTEETKKQVLFSLPMILTNGSYYLITLISVMFAGHLGQLHLAGATLANSWATVTGYALMIGLSGALETLCGQGFGAKSFRMLGIHLQASCITSLLFSVIVSLLWFYTEPLLIFLRQDTQIAQTAALYMKFLIPSIFASGFIQNILRFLQTQSVVKPLVLFSAIPLVIHIGITYYLVHLTPLGFKGAPLAVSITLWLSFFMLATYVMFAKEFERTWQGFSVESFCYILTNLKLALPSAAMVCLEYWAFEILVFLAGLMTNSEVTTSLIAIWLASHVNTEAIAYNIIYGLSAAASTRVSNELGAGRPDQARSAMLVTLKLCGLLAIIIVLALGFGHNIWAGCFSDSSTIIKSFASMTPLLVISIILDSFQGVLSGVARGCGWQHIAVYVNLAAFYFVGMTVASLLAFTFNLHVKGLWIGLICGLSCQGGTLLFITLRTKWTKLQLSENREKEDPILA
ncbi:Multi antimicrobial extrusion protein [Parasponia andersonii]|uniref:Protein DETOXIFICATION n=1 Tax=Parasponia andersonii TaxID=3476 RepID=A0A2P5AU43_PARAD|nr:Multi antimicrobial extrusion protein [Parasponia andersonii]